MCRSTAAVRHFGRENAEVAWERVDAVDELQANAAWRLPDFDPKRDAAELRSWTMAPTGDKRSSRAKATNAPQLIAFEAFLPAAMAVRAEEAGVKKAASDLLTVLVLSVLAGAFISFGAIFATTVAAGGISFTTADGSGALSAGLPYGIVRLLMGLVFSLGLILVIVSGAELFTGSNMIWNITRTTRYDFATQLRSTKRHTKGSCSIPDPFFPLFPGAMARLETGWYDRDRISRPVP